MNINKVFLCGHLTRDPERRVNPTGSVVTKFALAVNRTTKDANNGTTRNEVTYVNVECWGTYAETIAKNCVRGTQLYVEGRLKLDQWKGNDGKPRSALCVVLENFQFGQRAPSQRSTEPQDQSPATSQAQRQAPGTPQPGADKGEGNDDDVPF